MKVAVIVVNFNDAENTVQYIKKITEYENLQKIVVVDNCSTDANTMEILNQLQSEKVTVLQSEKNGGYSYGNNFGVKYLEMLNEHYDYFIISNPDIVIEKSAINKCLQVLEKEEKVAMVAPRMYNSSGKPIRRSSWKERTFGLDVIHSTRLLEFLFYQKLRAGEYTNQDYSKELLEVDNISGAFFVIKSEIFKQVGMFDENVFLFYEEDILSKKIITERL